MTETAQQFREEGPNTANLLEKKRDAEIQKIMNKLGLNKEQATAVWEMIEKSREEYLAKTGISMCRAFEETWNDGYLKGLAEIL